MQTRIQRWLLASTLAVSAVPALVSAQSPSNEVATDAKPVALTLDAQIRQHMSEGTLVGVAAAVIVDGRIAWSGGYGYADRQAGTPFTADTVMNIGSISKTVTGAALMRAVDQRRLSLDADVNRYLPFKLSNPHRPGTPITLRQLATHTSSITDRWPVYERVYHFGGDAPEALGDFIFNYLAPEGRDYSTENFLDVVPGTHRDYSNIGAGLAGHIVERATGQTLDAYTREQLFLPLGMTRTRWFMREAPMHDHATLYVVQDEWPLPLPPYGLTTWPDGGLRTSVNDLSRFFAAMLRGGELDGTRVLSRSAAREMVRLQFTAQHKPDNVDVAEKNSGLFWQTKFDTRYVGHGGSDPGLKTEMLATPTLDTGVILFANTSGSESTERAYVGILKALFAHAETLRAPATDAKRASR